MKRPLLSLFSVLALLACSGAQPGPGAEDDKLKTESVFCSEWAKAACNATVVSRCSGDRAGCLSTQKSACQVLIRPGYSSEHAEACIEAVEDAYEDAELTAEELEIVLKLGAPCNALIDGGQREGGACISTLDCNGVDGFECVIKAGALDGTCQVPSEIARGDSCRAAEAVCGPDDFCDGSRCITRLADEPCLFDDACPADYRCEILEGETEGACVERLPSGMCETNDDCQSRLCIGLTRKVCASNVVLTVESSLCDTLR